MIARGLDLSVGSVLAVSLVVSANVDPRDPAPAGLPRALVTASDGLLNAAFIVGFRVSPIIATLGTLNIARGAAFLITSSAILVGLPSNWSDLGTGYMFGHPVPDRRRGTRRRLLLGAPELHRLRPQRVRGRRQRGGGPNRRGQRLAHVRRSVRDVRSRHGLAAVVLGSRLGSGDPNIGVGFEFDCIVAVILGGTSLAGGEGRISGTYSGLSSSRS